MGAAIVNARSEDKPENCFDPEFDTLQVKLRQIWVQSKQWIKPAEPTPKKVKAIFSANKDMETTLWDPKGINLQ